MYRSQALALLVKTDVFQLHKATTVPTVAVPNNSLWILLLVSIVSLINMYMDMCMYILRGHVYCIGHLGILVVQRLVVANLAKCIVDVHIVHKSIC